MINLQVDQNFVNLTRFRLEEKGFSRINTAHVNEFGAQIIDAQRLNRDVPQFLSDQFKTSFPGSPKFGMTQQAHYNPVNVKFESGTFRTEINEDSDYSSGVISYDSTSKIISFNTMGEYFLEITSLTWISGVSSGLSVVTLAALPTPGMQGSAEIDATDGDYTAAEDIEIQYRLIPIEYFTIERSNTFSFSASELVKTVYNKAKSSIVQARTLGSKILFEITKPEDLTYYYRVTAVSKEADSYIEPVIHIVQSSEEMVLNARMNTMIALHSAPVQTIAVPANGTYVYDFKLLYGGVAKSVRVVPAANITVIRNNANNEALPITVAAPFISLEDELIARIILTNATGASINATISGLILR